MQMQRRPFLLSLVSCLAASSAALAGPPKLAARRAPPEDRPSLDRAIRVVGDHAYEVDRRALVSTLKSDQGSAQSPLLRAASRAARIVPEIKEGKVAGFRLYKVRPDSVLERLGFRHGDLIISVNGLPINSPEHALEVHARLASSKRVTVALERGRQPLTNVYVIR